MFKYQVWTERRCSYEVKKTKPMCGVALIFLASDGPLNEPQYAALPMLEL